MGKAFLVHCLEPSKVQLFQTLYSHLDSDSALLCLGSMSIDLNDFFLQVITLSVGMWWWGEILPFFPHSKSLKHASDHCSNAKWRCLTLPSTSIHLNLIAAKIAYQDSERIQYFTKHWTLALKQWLPGSWHCRIWRRMLFFFGLV